MSDQGKCAYRRISPDYQPKGGRWKCQLWNAAEFLDSAGRVSRPLEHIDGYADI
jgi:hypothetical protein